ncbi:MAG TPA: hypothetical protein PKE12_05705 [Kiritimatiellia bacterium]|nr:hypothetical protein [Kiritimatiellia bacterium]
MNKGIVIALLVTLAECTAARAEPRAAMRQGVRAFEAGKLSDAAAHFEQAAAEARPAGLDPSVAHFNRGVALYRDQLWDGAADAFLEARLTPDLTRQALALYNAGSCRIRQVQSALEIGEGKTIEKHLSEAIDFLGQSLLVRPDQPDVRHNLEVALAIRDALTAFVFELGTVVQQADRLVGQHQFPEAHRLLSGAQERLGPALKLPKPEVKSFEQLLERTGQIVQILEAPSPTAPVQ